MRLLIRALLFCTLAASASMAVLRVGPAFLQAHVKPGSLMAETKASALAAVRGVEELSYPLVVTRVPSRNPAVGPVTEGMLPIDSCEGGQVLIYYPNGSRLNLTAGFDRACDPEVSFDGQRILFAGERSAADDWNIHEIGSDGAGLRQVTSGLGDCRSPLYLSMLYTLISDNPWHQIAFVSNVAQTAGEYGLWPVAAIYSSRIDGTDLMRLTHGPSGDSNPYQMPDGRLLFSGWRPRLPERQARLPLFAVNIDGTDFTLFSDSEGLRHKRMPCVTTKRLAIFVESEQLRSDEAGNLASVTLRRNFHSYRQLTKEGDGLFRSPSPLPDGRILVSMRDANGKGTFGICIFDPESGAVVPVLDDPEFDEIQAKILVARPEPDGRSTSVLRRTGEIEDPHALEPQDKKSGAGEIRSGRLYCLNVYNSGFTSPATLPRGAVKRVRVLEGLPATLIPSRKIAGDGSARLPGNVGPPILKRRFIGEAPVEADGSFNLHVPADVPIELQILDADGLALASCSWIWIKNNEPRGCIGCHEDPELVPENRLVAAIAKPSMELVLPPERRRSIDFLHDIKPIIRSRCVTCHKTGGFQPRLDDVKDSAGIADLRNPDGSYQSLLGRGQEEDPGSLPGGKYVTIGRARTSPLIWHLFGRNTSRPWDSPATAATFKPMPPVDGSALSENERRTFAEWIDTGAHWDSRSAQSPAVDTGGVRGVIHGDMSSDIRPNLTAMPAAAKSSHREHGEISDAPGGQRESLAPGRVKRHSPSALSALSVTIKRSILIAASMPPVSIIMPRLCRYMLEGHDEN